MGAALFMAVFLSGAAALVYQVCWQRILALHSGIGLFSVALIVGAFMAGLGLGNLLGGALSPRLERRQALLAFAGLEMAIGIFGAFSAWLYYDWLYLNHVALYGQTSRAALLHFVALLPPTLLMGMSLPFLTRATVTTPVTAGRVVAWIYGINVLGAAVGSVAAPWWLIRHHGMRFAITIAAACNLVAAVAAVAAAARAKRASSPAVPATASSMGRGWPPMRWMALYALSGFIALSLEMVWFRVLDIAVRATAFTFGTLLAGYLLGNAIGAIGGRWLKEAGHGPLARFIACQCALLVLSALALGTVVWVPAYWPLVSWFAEIWEGARSYNLGGAWNSGSVFRLYVVLPGFLFGLPTILMGVSMATLQTAVHDDPRTSGLKVGWLQAANIVGCVAGALLTGIALLNWLGTTGTVRALLVVGLVFVGFGWRHVPRARRWFAAWAAAILVLVGALPGQDAFWLRFHGETPGRSLVEEDATGVVALTPGRRETWAMWVSGKHFSTIPYGGIHTLLGALPSMMHTRPERIALIGLGSGDTAWASGSRLAATREIHVFEISAPQKAILERFRAAGLAPRALEQFLDDRRVTLRVADGRNAIEQSKTLYDVIEMDPLRPSNAYSGNLYSREFFERCARKLRAGGFMCTWAPSPRVRATFRTVFSHTVDFAGGTILVGSRDPFPVDVAAWQARLLEPGVRAYLGPQRWADVRNALATARETPFSGASRREINTDLFPRDEFNTPE